MSELLNNLKNASNEYRPVPFWSWNDKLEPDILKWQIREMKKAGLGGYFMHARSGLKTRYLSEEWMECIKACIEEGKALGMGAWCYDEEGWPSGFAGGIVPSLGEKYHVKWLELTKYDPENTVTVENALGFYKINNENIAVSYKTNKCYVDILSREVVAEFLKSTHEKYYSLFKEDFGNAMPGFFTDEPQYSSGRIPWSEVIPSSFLNAYGYDLLESLPALFLECEGYERIRYDFWKLVNELYTNSFMKQIYDWCNEHGCKLTGHVMAEEGLHGQMYATAGVMPSYQYMHIPGIDWLGRKISSPLSPKQVASVAHQLGKKLVLTETFALCGWDVSFEELKWIAEFQYVNGVNLMCQHLEGYSLKGIRKRDYPPSMFYQQPWWREYALFNDYFTRLGVLLTSGKYQAEVLLLHPVRSAWLTYNGTANQDLKWLDDEFFKAVETLSGLHADYHLGDEEIMKKHGRVEDGRLIVGQCAYKAVVLPSMVTIDASTLGLLKEFVSAGGKVISIGKLPEYCEGRKSEETDWLKSNTICTDTDTKALKQFIQETGASNIDIMSDGVEVNCIHYMQRLVEDTQVLYLVNHDNEKSYATQVTLRADGSVCSLDVLSLEKKALQYSQQGGFLTFPLDFEPMQSHVILIESHSGIMHTEAAGMKIKPGTHWKIEKMDLNALTLDYCSYSIDGGSWNEPVPVIQLMDKLLEMKRSCDIAMGFDFEIDMDLSLLKEFYLVMEDAENFEININGTEIKYTDIGYWKDISFKKIDIRQHLINGSNHIILRRRFYQSPKVYEALFGENILETETNKLTYDVELESIYLVGNFGVKSKSSYTSGDRKALFTKGPFVITDSPCIVTGSDLTQQGLCFFSGSITLGQEIIVPDTPDNIVLDLGHPKAAMCKAYLNGVTVKPLFWAPYKIDITGYVKPGTNKLEVQLFSGNRNLLGPHHHKRGELYAVCPTSFGFKKGWGEEDMDDQWTDTYCFVEFGMGE
ncbi:MAG: glycosyl hydrolase [Clostridia bacterium]|nr:glycosyl hydrolase [Clostridia bacterium]